MSNLELFASSIEIENFIFHVVHHRAPEPFLMDNTPITGFEVFFKMRIAEVVRGNKFLFNDPSYFLTQLAEIEASPDKFLEVSKDFATRFHTPNDKRIKPGVMILIQARIYNERKYILIKYDHEDVITYKTDSDKANSNEAILESISNTFSKSKSALQKSVVVDLNEEGPIAIIIDKSEASGITDFFKDFLSIKRFYDSKTLTERVKKSYLETLNKHKDHFPPSYTSKASQTFYDVVQSQDIFDNEETAKLLFGNLYNDEVQKTFNNRLKSNDILGETFDFDKSIRKPRKKKLKTIEGISIEYLDNAEDTIKINSKGDFTEIVITTAKLFDES